MRSSSALDVVEAMEAREVTLALFASGIDQMFACPLRRHRG